MSSFFIEHLKEFEIWLKFGVDKHEAPTKLPVVLQVKELRETAVDIHLAGAFESRPSSSRIGVVGPLCRSRLVGGERGVVCR